MKWLLLCLFFIVVWLVYVVVDYVVYAVRVFGAIIVTLVNCFRKGW